MKLSFMTFVCPEWEIEKVVQFAGKAGYDGVELRVDSGHKHGISARSSSQQRRYVRKLFADEDVEAACIATSVEFGLRNRMKRKEAVESAKANLALAADLGARVIRIFAGPDMATMTDEAADYIAEAFTEVGDYAMQFGVCPMLETMHDIVKSPKDAVEVIKRVKTPNFGILWNQSELDQGAFDLLKDHIRHFHVHDEVLAPANENILHLARRMKGAGFDGYISLEIYGLSEQRLLDTAKRLGDYIKRA